MSFCHSLSENLFDYALRQAFKADIDDSQRRLPGSQLRCLSLSGCNRVTSHTVRHVTFLCGDSLQQLDISWCRNVECSVLWYLAGLALHPTHREDGTSAVFLENGNLAKARELSRPDGQLFLWLEWLDVLGGKGLTLAPRRTYSPALTSLDISGIDLSTFGQEFAFVTFQAFALCCGKHLQRLAISSRDLAEETVKDMTLHLSNLSSLSLAREIMSCFFIL